jgi:hypothetical protein
MNFMRELLFLRYAENSKSSPDAAEVHPDEDTLSTIPVIQQL